MATTQRTLFLDAPASPALAIVLINPSCSRGGNVNHSCRQCLKRTLETWGYDAEAYDALALRETGKRRSRAERQRCYVKGDPETAAYHRHHKYGLTSTAYNALIVEQQGVCALCQQPETRMVKGTLASLAVDHDHTSGRVRGLLCSYCNSTLGDLEKLGPQWIRLAQAYLTLHGAILLAKERCRRDELLLAMLELQDANKHLKQLVQGTTTGVSPSKSLLL